MKVIDEVNLGKLLKKTGRRLEEVRGRERGRAEEVKQPHSQHETEREIDK